MADRTGQTLGHYRLVRLLGQGGFADVYLGEHLHLGTEAALKLLHTRLAGKDTDAFRWEARTIARLVHPHIVRVFDFGIEGETPYLVIDYAPNGTVRKQHPKGVTFPLPTVLSYVKQTASALQYAHDEHFIHRDVKPENLLVGRWQEILLGDFGIALLAQTSRSQSIQDVAGTASYMAPEQFQGKPRPASDQYALAVMVYEWLIGACPFHGSFTEVASQHLFVPPPPLQGRTPTISPVVEQVVLTALAKDPHQRFSSVQAFAMAFEQACQVETSPTRPSSQSLSPTETMPQPRSTQSPMELAPPSGKSVIPVELITPPSQSSVPPGQSMSPSQHLVPTEQSALPSQTEGPPAMVTPPRQASLLPTELASPARKAAALPTEGTRLPQLPGTHPAEMIPPRLPQRGCSRRTVVVGLAGLVVAGIACGGIALLTNSQQPSVPVASTLYTYQGHSGVVDAIAWSPDGQRLASGSNDATVQVWDATNGGHVFTYRGHSDVVGAVAWSPDGQRLASGSDDKTVQVWDATNGGHVFTYQGHSDVVDAVAWSLDGKRLASGSNDATVQVWDATNGGHVFTYRGHSGVVDAVAWSPDGQRLASGSNDATVQVWDATNGGHVFTYRGHSSYGVDAVAWSPDGKRLASGSNDATVQVWDATNGGHVFTYQGHSDAVRAVAWSLDGKRLASGSNDRTVQVWDATNGGHVFTYRGHSSYGVDAVVWSPDGQRLASGSDDKTVQVWDATSSPKSSPPSSPPSSPKSSPALH